MNHGPIVVSEDGFKAMNISADFAKYAREHGIRDPFEVSRQLFSKRCRREGTDLIVNFDWDEETHIAKCMIQENKMLEVFYHGL